MRIAINTLPLLDNKAGAERYTQNLLEHIGKLDHENEYLLILSKVNQQFYRIERENFENIVYKGNTRSKIFRILGEQLYVPLRMRRFGVDVFFSPCNIAPRFISAPLVLTLFDLHWLIFPQLFTKARVAYLKKAIGWSVNKASAIITISENSRKDIIETYKVPEEKIRVISVGLDPIFRKKHDDNKIAKVLLDYGIKGKFILTVCQLHKRKNLLRLIKAFSSLRKSKKIDHALVLTGGKGDGYSEIMSYVNKNGLDDVIITGCVPDRDVCLLYNAANLVVYPSLYEGFGLPVIEAMACGTPVITSNTSSMGEAAGGAAILIDPYSVDDIANAIENTISNKEVQNNLIQKGFRQAKKFSWEKAAQETVKVFEEVYNDARAVGKA